MIKNFDIADGWKRNVIPTDTILEECYVSPEGEIKYQGIFYTGKLRIRMAGGISSSLVDFGRQEREKFVPDWNDTYYWRHTGISKSHSVDLNSYSTGWDYVYWYQEKNTTAPIEDAFGFALFQIKMRNFIHKTPYEKDEEFTKSKSYYECNHKFAEPNTQFENELQRREMLNQKPEVYHDVLLKDQIKELLAKIMAKIRNIFNV